MYFFSLVVQDFLVISFANACMSNLCSFISSLKNMHRVYIYLHREGVDSSYYSCKTRNVVSQTISLFADSIMPVSQITKASMHWIGDKSISLCHLSHWTSLSVIFVTPIQDIPLSYQFCVWLDNFLPIS